MPVTVREVLDLEPLRRAGPRVLSAADNLDRAVRWVHVAELPDIAHLLRGGELLLTTGLGMAGTPAERRRYVEELAGAGAAGVVVELGRTFAAVPEELVEAAEARGLPLVSLDRETRFVEVTEIVHREILSRQYDLLDRAEHVSRELAHQILDGADVGKLVAHLGADFGTVVVFEDAAQRVVATSEHPRGDDGPDVASAWDRHARLRHDGPGDRTPESGTVHRAPGNTRTPGCAWVDIWIRHERWGRLHVLDAAAGHGDVDELLVDRAGAALALAMLSEKDAAHLAERAGDALIGEIVAGRHGSRAETLRRAKNLGADLETGRLMAAALEVRTAATHDLADGDRLEVLRSLTVALRAAVDERRCSALVGTSGDRVIAIVAIPGTRPVAAVLEEMVEAASARLRRRGGIKVVAGSSGPAPIEALHRAVEEAMVAAGFARDAGTARRVHHFAELGTYQLLARLADGPELGRFVDSELRPLLDRERAAKPRLIPTLRAYLKHAGRKADAARELGVQRRTLYQRLARVEALLGRDLDEQSTRTRLTLALQGLDYLAGRAGGAGHA